MSYQIYPWNPFGTNQECEVTNELVTVLGDERDLVVPRYAPFFEKDFVLKDAQTGVELKPGKDYVFAYPFHEFVEQYGRTVYGGITLLVNGKNRQLTISSYKTLGEPFTQNDADFITLAANIVHTERTAQWSQVVNLPAEGFPADPHEHEVDLTYNYQKLIEVLTALDEAQRDEFNNPTVASELVEHLNKSFKLAHPNASAKDFNLDLVANYRPAKDEDLEGNSDELYMTLAKVRKLIVMILKDLDIYPDQDPTEPGDGEDPTEYLTIEEGLKLFLSQNALFSEIRAKGASAQATARNNLGLRGGATANVVQGTGDSETDVMSQRAVSELLGDITFNTVSWVYEAQGGELSLQPPHEFMNCLVFLNGLAQPTSYSFIAELGEITLAEQLLPGDLVEVIMDAPITKSWFYQAVGGEEELKPPYEIQNVILFIDGWEQIERYSFTNDNETIFLAEPLLPGERVEMIFDVPLTSQNSIYVNKQVAELQAQMKEMQERVANLRGEDFLSKDADQALYAGTDKQIYISDEDLQYIKSVEIEVDEDSNNGG